MKYMPHNSIRIDEAFFYPVPQITQVDIKYKPARLGIERTVGYFRDWVLGIVKQDTFDQRAVFQEI
jgi:hypothetical protein